VDASLSKVVLAREPQINELERQVDREAFRLIALHQPMASDLRMAKAVSRITVELERVGDEAKKIARFAGADRHRRAARPSARCGRYLRHMADLTAGMLRDAVRALDEADTDLARGVAGKDSELDAEFAAALRQLLTLAMQDQRFLRRHHRHRVRAQGSRAHRRPCEEYRRAGGVRASGEDVRHQEAE
jgi:phosphate transport system protein